MAIEWTKDEEHCLLVCLWKWTYYWYLHNAPLAVQQWLSQPDGKLVPFVQKQCGRLMTDNQCAQQRQQQAIVWTDFSIQTSPVLHCHTKRARGDGESLFSTPGAWPLTHIWQVQSAPTDTWTCNFSVRVINRWDADDWVFKSLTHILQVIKLAQTHIQYITRVKTGDGDEIVLFTFYDMMLFTDLKIACSGLFHHWYWCGTYTSCFFWSPLKVWIQ